MNDGSQNRDLVLQALAWRYATKKFDPARKISNADWETLQESLRLSASSYGLQPWRFIDVQSTEIRKKLTPHSWNQTQVEDCSHFVVFAHRNQIDDSYVREFATNLASARKVGFERVEAYFNLILEKVVKPERPATEVAHWTARQAYLAMGTLLMSAALLQIDACPMEGIEPSVYDEILNLRGSRYQTVAAVALGYRATDDAHAKNPKVRFSTAQIFETR